MDREREAGGDFTEECKEAVGRACCVFDSAPPAPAPRLAWTQPLSNPTPTTPRLHVQTMRLRECMLSNKEYYAPLLEEEEAEAARLAAADNEGGPAATEGDEPAAPSEPEP